MSQCLSCGEPTVLCLDFGVQSVADFFVNDRGLRAPSYDLKIVLCDSCKLVQLANPPSATILFRNNYPFRTSSSRGMSRHFRSLAERFIVKLPRNAQVLEIGSNDGAFTCHFASKGFLHLGVDPASDACAIAETKNVNTFPAFFDSESVTKIQSEYGSFDLIFAANTFSHINKINEVLQLSKSLLAPDGSIVSSPGFGGGDPFDREFLAFFFQVAVDRGSAHGEEFFPDCGAVALFPFDEFFVFFQAGQPLGHVRGHVFTARGALDSPEVDEDFPGVGGVFPGFGLAAIDAVDFRVAEGGAG